MNNGENSYKLYNPEDLISKKKNNLFLQDVKILNFYRMSGVFIHSGANEHQTDLNQHSRTDRTI